MKLFKSRKGLSPLVATLLLVVFALVIGTATMSWGKDYVDRLEEQEEAPKATIVIYVEDIDTDLKELQIKYLTGVITEDQYYALEQELKS